MAETAVVHLVRAANGVQPFQAFLDSYRRCQAGLDHELLLVFKGFGGETIPPQYRAALAGLPHRSLWLRDWGLDLRAYFAATRIFPARAYCFLNSFSVLLGESWLAKLVAALSRPGVGLVGATGSLESPYSSALAQTPASPLGRVRASWHLHWLRDQFDPFPNCHVRTNGFLVSAEVWNRIRPGWIHSKAGAYRFESGKNGLTRQVKGMELEALVVGRDGRGLAQDSWARSRTFRSGNQENLLIGDNRTRDYLRADQGTRRRLQELAWGQAETA